MKTASKRRKAWLWPAIMSLLVAWLHCAAQTNSDAPQIGRKIVIVPEQVVQEQWPAMRDFVHVPAEAKQIEPGQCVRFAVTASGIGSDKMLREAKFSFEYTFLGKTQTFAMEPVQAFKETTLITHESLAKSLQSVEAAKSLLLARYMAVSRAGWCAPTEVADGSASVTGSATTADGKTISFEKRSVEVKTFETARKHRAFKDLQTLSDWTMHYHELPDPAQLLPAIRIVAADAKARDMTNVLSFFSAALKASAPAADELIRRLPGEDHWTRLYSAAVLREAGYSTEALLGTLSEADKSMLQAVHLADPYDMTPNSEIGARQDMLWGIFFATGSIKPVRTIVSELAWSDDYGKFKKAVDAREHQEWSDSLGRAAGYSSAGWSIASLSQQDTVLDDYVDALKKSSDTPPAIKTELENLYKNPAFRGPGSK